MFIIYIALSMNSQSVNIYMSNYRYAPDFFPGNMWSSHVSCFKTINIIPYENIVIKYVFRILFGTDNCAV